MKGIKAKGITARKFAQYCGIELVGKLTKKVNTTKEFDLNSLEDVVVKTTYWEDEIGNKLYGNKKEGWVLVTPEGNIY